MSASEVVENLYEAIKSRDPDRIEQVSLAAYGPETTLTESDTLPWPGGVFRARDLLANQVARLRSEGATLIDWSQLDHSELMVAPGAEEGVDHVFSVATAPLTADPEVRIRLLEWFTVRGTLIEKIEVFAGETAAVLERMKA